MAKGSNLARDLLFISLDYLFGLNFENAFIEANCTDFDLFLNRDRNQILVNIARFSHYLKDWLNTWFIVTTF